MDPTQQAFVDFMLRGKKTGPPPTNSPPSTSLSSSSSSSFHKSERLPHYGTARKAVAPIFKAFQGRVQEWIELDSQLEAVVASISNLRDRIVWETKQHQQQQQQNVMPQPWNGFGYHHHHHHHYATNSFLLPKDVTLAYTNDLLQHEKMLTASRTLVSAMALAQDGMGRRLDEWMTMTMMMPHDDEAANNSAITTTASAAVSGIHMLEQAQHVYTFLAEELYQRQSWVQQLVQSCHDGLLEDDDDDDAATATFLGDSRAVARRCRNHWREKERERKQLTEGFLAQTTGGLL